MAFVTLVVVLRSFSEGTKAFQNGVVSKCFIE